MWLGLSTTILPSLLPPASTPAGTAKIIPNKSPKRTRKILIPKDFNNMPSLFKSIKACITSYGDGKERSSIGERVVKNHKTKMRIVEIHTLHEDTALNAIFNMFFALLGEL
ncbi:hypothetical protein GVAMD_0214 [Gardnerella vaginalis AMD]|nr:hypothetical protein GVAMD_0214 [Gardnerella vaginalis AMD]